MFEIEGILDQYLKRLEIWILINNIGFRFALGIAQIILSLKKIIQVSKIYFTVLIWQKKGKTLEIVKWIIFFNFQYILWISELCFVMKYYSVIVCFEIYFA